MNKTKIEYVDFSWNPIKGLCPVGCWYCYARKIYKRFGMNPKVFLNLNELIMPFPKKSSRIFVCSTFELFHPVADKWRDEIFEVINLEPQHTFIILTKMPENIDRPMPDNAWLGVSVTGKNGDDDRIRILCNDSEDKHKFISFEPLLGDVAMKGWNAFPDYVDTLFWCIVGRLTDHGHAQDPSRANVKRIVDECRRAKVPVFLKNNLREIWGGPLIQEFPK